MDAKDIILGLTHLKKAKNVAKTHLKKAKNVAKTLRLLN